MRRTLTRGRLLALLALACGVFASLTPPDVRSITGTVRAATPVNWEFKNFSMLAWDETALYESNAALDSLVNTGATSVTLVFMWYADSQYVSDMCRTTGTASDASLVYAIRQAKARGLNVMLKPHLDPLDGAWRAYINPSDADAWFTNYRHALLIITLTSPAKRA